MEHTLLKAEKRCYQIFGILFLLFLLYTYLTYSENSITTSAKVVEKQKVSITFDDGPHPVYTKQLLEGLRERGVVATFFVTGEHAKLYPELIEEMAEDGHLVGNHTYHHVQLSAVGDELFIKELEETTRVLSEILGEEILFVRPPFGEWTKEIEAKCEMFPVLWDIDPLDWCNENVDEIVTKVVTDVQENDIILMHDEYASSIEAALQIVDILMAQGYEFVTVDELILN
ncbi:MAG: polysaccharide deacetylase family protein [Lachnospiraceae bacterium]